MREFFVPLFAIWAAVAVVVIVLALYRKIVSNREDDSLHISDGEASILAEQNVVAQKLTKIDRWGKTLTVVVAAYGLVLGGFFVYYSWVDNNAASTHLEILH